jgi:hypothetical protein
VFAGYRIDGVLDRGGMGVVYTATDVDLDRSIALKIIAPEHVGDPTAVARFKAEARLAASLEHPNIVPVYRGGEHDGVLYLAMRLVEGTNLRRVIGGSPVELGLVANIVAQIASALDAAHARGLVHRDVKPANILLSGAGADMRVYLTDFGLTKRLGATGGLTRSGGWVGTPDYVAPEQIRGDSLDARADVYSLGCVIYEMLTGHAPYPGEAQVAKMWAHVTDPPPRPCQERPELVDAFDAVVARALAKDQGDRYATAGDLASALQMAVSQQHAERGHDAAAGRVHRVGPAATGDTTHGSVTCPQEPVATSAGRSTTAAQSLPRLAGPRSPEPERSVIASGSPARRGRRWLIVAVGVVLAGIGAAIAVPRGDRPRNAPAPVTHTDARSAAGRSRGALPPRSFAVRAPQAVAIGAGALWIAGRDGTLTRIDPASGARSRVAVGPRPDGVAVAFGSVWVSLAGADRVVRVNAGERPKVLRSVKVGSRPGGLAASSHAVWVANAGDGTLSQILPSTGAVRTVPAVGREPFALAIGAGAVWVADRGGGTLARVNGGRDRLAATVPIGPQPDAVAIVGRDVWVATAGDGRIWRVHGDANSRAGSVRVGGSPRAIAAEGRRIWVTDQARDQLIRINAAAMRVGARQPAPRGPVAVAVDRDAVWVAGAGRVSRLAR